MTCHVSNQTAEHCNDVAPQCPECGEDMTQDDFNEHSFVCDALFCEGSLNTMRDE